KMQVVSTGGTAEDQAAAAILQLALNGELDSLDDEAGDDEAPALAEGQVWLQDADGNLTHAQSKAQCPLAWGLFERNATQIYVPDGTNVGCNYSRAAADAAMTFYAYQSDVVLQADVDNAFASMRQRVPVSKEVAFSELPGANWYL